VILVVIIVLQVSNGGVLYEGGECGDKCGGAVIIVIAITWISNERSIIQASAEAVKLEC